MARMPNNIKIKLPIERVVSIGIDRSEDGDSTCYSCMFCGYSVFESVELMNHFLRSHAVVTASVKASHSDIMIQAGPPLGVSDLRSMGLGDSALARAVEFTQHEPPAKVLKIAHEHNGPILGLTIEHLGKTVKLKVIECEDYDPMLTQQ